MTYRDNLNPWAVFRCNSPNNICVARFRSRRNAEEYVRILRQVSPAGDFQVVFDQVKEAVPG
jgi:hypothetical protein